MMTEFLLLELFGSGSIWCRGGFRPPFGDPADAGSPLQVARPPKSVREYERWREYGLTGSRQEEVWWLYSANLKYISTS
jgi:hypothetical protein